jgi:hypothetical protein
MVLATAASEACGQAAAPVGAGGACALTTDCAEGYECITQAGGNRVCSNDFSTIQSTEDAEVDATSAVPNEAAPPGDSTATPDHGVTPAEDSGSSLRDTGSPSADTGAPPKDTGAPPPDTGAPLEDTGTVLHDTGTPVEDTGTVVEDTGTAAQDG